MSLVPAYASSSDEKDDSTNSSANEDEAVNETIDKHSKESIPLPKASVLLPGQSKGATTGHVFNNPYKDEENAKIASLEKHVKMGFNVNRHLSTEKGAVVSEAIVHSPMTKWRYPAGTATETTQETNEDLRPNFSQPPNVKKKKRPVLGNSIVPSKKVMKHYQQTKESL